MLKPGETHLMTPQEQPDAHIQPMRYLIQCHTESDYWIHKELDAFESQHYQPMHKFEYNGGTYLCGFARVTSQEQAERLVASYWCAIDNLNQATKPVAHYLS